MVSCMARLSRFVTVAALLGGATVSLSACTGGSDPIASPSPSVSTVVTPSPSVSPSPTPLTDDQLLALIPEDARAENFVSASNFAKFFVREYQRMLTEQDRTLFSSLSEPDCLFCNSALATFDSVVSTGGSVEGGDVAVDDGLALGGMQDDGTYIATIHVTTAPQTNRDATGAIVEQTPEGSGLISVQMRRSGDHWVVVDVNLAPAEGA